MFWFYVMTYNAFTLLSVECRSNEGCMPHYLVHRIFNEIKIKEKKRNKENIEMYILYGIEVDHPFLLSIPIFTVE